MNTDDIKLKRIEEIVSSYNLTFSLPQTNLAKKERFFVFQCENKAGKKYSIKFLRKPEFEEEDFLKKFTNEIIFLKYLQDKNLFLKEHTQQILAFDLKEVWRIANFVVGDKLTNQNDDYPYESEMLEKIDQVELCDFFFTLQKLNYKDLEKTIPSLPKYGFSKHREYYRRMEPAQYILNNFENKTYKFLTEEENEKLYKIYLDPWDNYFQNPGILHADLSPENILAGEDNFYILDWENVGLGPKMIDFVSFWSRSFLNPQFQDKIFKLLLEKHQESQEFFKEFYRTFLLSFLGVYEYYHLNKELKNISKEQLNRAVEFLINTYQKAKIYL